MKTSRFTAVLIMLCAAGCARTPAQKEALLLEKAKSYIAEKDYTRAMIELRNAVQIMPKDAEPYYQLALIAMEQQEANLAIRLLRKAVELNPQHANAQLRLAGFELSNRDTTIVESAVKRVQGVLNLAPNNSDALQMLAMTELRLGKNEDAQRDLRLALDKAPENVQAAFNLAKLRLLQNDFQGAEAVLKKATQDAPKSVPAELVLAGFYLSTQRVPEAEAHLKRALDLDSNNLLGLLSLATVQVQTGRPADAEKLYRRISDLPNSPAKQAHAIFLFDQGRRDDAIKELAKLNKSDPKDRTVRGILISAYLESGRRKDADAMLADALKKNPKDTDALMLRGALNLSAGNLQQVETDMNTVLNFRSDSGQAHYTLSRVFQARGQVARQKQELGDALKWEPNLLAARVDLAKLLLRANQATEALDLLDRAPPAQQSAPVYIAQRGWVLMALGKTAELRKNIEAGLAASSDPQFSYQEALLKISQKDYPAARTVLEELMKKYPQSSSSLDLLAQTYLSQGNLNKAVDVVLDYASREPKSAYLKYVVGTWQLRAKRQGLARQAFKESIAADPKYTPPALLLAEMELTDGNLKLATDVLNGILSHDQNNPRAHFLLALVDQRGGNSADAEQQYRAAVSGDPSNEEALNNLAALLQTSKPAEALDFAQKALELAPEDPAVWDTVGWLYYQKGAYPVALSHLKNAVSKGETAVRRYHLAMAYSKLGDSAEAQKNLKTARRLDPQLHIEETVQ